MSSCYAEFIDKITKDIRFRDTKFSFTEYWRKCYKNKEEHEIRTLRIVLQVDVKNGLFLRTHSFRINYNLDDNSTEVVTNLGYVKEQYTELDYKKISLFIYESIEDLKRKDLSIRKVL